MLRGIAPMLSGRRPSVTAERRVVASRTGCSRFGIGCCGASWIETGMELMIRWSRREIVIDLQMLHLILEAQGSRAALAVPLLRWILLACTEVILMVLRPKITRPRARAQTCRNSPKALKHLYIIDAAGINGLKMHPTQKQFWVNQAPSLKANLHQHS
jgi:hypothetical protein